MDEDEQNLQKALQASMQPAGMNHVLWHSSLCAHPKQLPSTCLVLMQQLKQKQAPQMLTLWYVYKC